MTQLCLQVCKQDKPADILLEAVSKTNTHCRAAFESIYSVWNLQPTKSCESAFPRMTFNTETPCPRRLAHCNTFFLTIGSWECVRSQWSLNLVTKGWNKVYRQTLTRDAHLDTWTSALGLVTVILEL